MWHRDMKWANVIGKMLPVDLLKEALPRPSLCKRCSPCEVQSSKVQSSEACLFRAPQRNHQLPLWNQIQYCMSRIKVSLRSSQLVLGGGEEKHFTITRGTFPNPRGTPEFREGVDGEHCVWFEKGILMSSFTLSPWLKTTDLLLDKRGEATNNLQATEFPRLKCCLICLGQER